MLERFEMDHINSFSRYLNRRTLSIDRLILKTIIRNT